MGGASSSTPWVLGTPDVIGRRKGGPYARRERGFNPHHPKDPSYYPLTAHLAQTGQFLDVWNRPGNIHDSVDAVRHLGALIKATRARLGAVPIEVLLDGAFCQKAVFELLEASGVEYALRVPMWQWLRAVFTR